MAACWLYGRWRLTSRRTLPRPASVSGFLDDTPIALLASRPVQYTAPTPGAETVSGLEWQFQLEQHPMLAQGIDH